ncbi:hypothetical protein [Pseudoduganella violacea]|uniref:Uncharacterized protein n=1 Tax=Pseudoduganella violacea TaxID=1715466 RepID=A0A7W5FXK7_9BURK|nr:hypothetical protein [Pseudoduganella violacea]MBB3122378.1 hypothetical protein [Pseudoduganella violacea]
MSQAHEILERARHARLAGKFEDALRDHLWFHENALETDPSLNGVRLSFALRDWIYLGEQFPLARRALQGLRDRDTARLLNGDATLARFQDISAINGALGEERATHDLFTQIDANLPDLARQCADLALPALVACEDFALARRYLPQPVERIGAMATRLNNFAEELARGGKTSSAPALLAYVLNYAKEVRLILEVLRRQGEDEEVEQAGAAALEQLKSDALRDAVQREFEQPGATIAAMLAQSRNKE